MLYILGARNRSQHWQDLPNETSTDPDILLTIPVSSPGYWECKQQSHCAPQVYILLVWQMSDGTTVAQIDCLWHFEAITQITIAPSVDKGWIVIWIYIGNGQCLPDLRMIMKIVSVRGRAPPIFTVLLFSRIQFSRRWNTLADGYNLYYHC